MNRTVIFLMALFVGFQVSAQDDLYDDPEPQKIHVYSAPTSTSENYEGVDDYNPNYDYRYRRSLRRLYDPYYVMPSSAYLNMYSYPQFNSFYNPYYSGFSISIGSGWSSPYYNSWSNPYYSWNNWGFNNCYSNWGWGGYHSFYSNYYSPYYYNSWNQPYYSGWNSWNNYYNGWYGGGRYNNGYNYRPSRPYNNYTNVNGQPAHSNIDPPVRRIPRAVRGMDANRDYGNTTYSNPSTSGSGGGWSTPSRSSSGSSTPSYNNSNTNTNTGNSNSGNNNNNSHNSSSSPSRSGGGGRGGRF